MSYVSASFDGNLAEGYTFFLEDIPSERSVFSIDPCFNYQLEVNKHVSFGDF